MATLANFLVGIGLDFDDKGAKQASSSLDSIKSTALQAGAAVAGAFGAKALTADVNNRTLELTRFSDVFGSTAEEVFAMGRVLEREGGTINGFMSQMEGLERLRSGLLTGDISWIPEGALAGLDTTAIMNASNALEAYQELAKQFPTLSPQQRINVAESIGLDQSSILLLSKGIDNLESEFSRIRNIRPIDDEMINNAEEYNKQWEDLKDNIGGVADSLSNTMSPILNGILKSSNEIFDLWREGSSLFDIVGETSPGGRLSAEATFGEGAAWLDRSIGDVVSEAVADSAFWADSIGKSIREMVGFDSAPAMVPTVINPQAVAPLSAPVVTTQSYGDSVISNSRSQSAPSQKTRTLQPIQVQIGNQTIKNIVIEIMDDEEQQIIKDIRSPMKK